MDISNRFGQKWKMAEEEEEGGMDGMGHGNKIRAKEQKQKQKTEKGSKARESTNRGIPSSRLYCENILNSSICHGLPEPVSGFCWTKMGCFLRKINGNVGDQQIQPSPPFPEWANLNLAPTKFRPFGPPPPHTFGISPLLISHFSPFPFLKLICIAPPPWQRSPQNNNWTLKLKSFKLWFFYNFSALFVFWWPIELLTEFSILFSDPWALDTSVWEKLAFFLPNMENSKLKMDFCGFWIKLKN